jgi:membrane-associated phospholipid phosphatase
MPLRLLAAAVLLAGAASAQPADRALLPLDTEPLDVRAFRAVYGVEARPFAVSVRAIDESAYPVFLGAAPALLAGAALTETTARPAIRLGLAEAGTVGLTYALKNLIRRPRPYVALDGVRARDRRHVGEVFDPFSFPSGHASTAFSIATSLSLSYPEWYVVAPAAVWAGGMGLARVWLGVHYPSDVLAGAAIGTGAAVLVHVLLPTVVPGEEGGEAVGAVVPLRVVVPL